MIGNCRFVEDTSLISSIHLPCEPRSLALYTQIISSLLRLCNNLQLTNPIILTSLFSNSSFIFANAPSSVVQTGVKSAGCENSIAQLFPIHWWKSISPLVVCALKFGAARYKSG